MVKWLILFLGAWLVIRAARASRVRGSSRVSRPFEAERMRPCAHCGLNVPETEALIEDESVSYCCAAHQRLGPVQGQRR